MFERWRRELMNIQRSEYVSDILEQLEKMDRNGSVPVPFSNVLTGRLDVFLDSLKKAWHLQNPSKSPDDFPFEAERREVPHDQNPEITQTIFVFQHRKSSQGD